MERLSSGEKVPLLPPTHTVARIVVNTSGQTETIPAPGAGFALQVVGYYIRVVIYANGVVTGHANMSFLTSIQEMWLGAGLQPAANGELFFYMSGLLIQGADNEALTITNGTVSGGSPNVIVADVFYRTVVV